MNGKSSMFSMCPPFALSSSKGEQRVFQQNPCKDLTPNVNAVVFFLLPWLFTDRCKRSSGAAQSRAGPQHGFLRLANALSALYPRGSEEKLLLDAVLLAVPR
jgi:hypothetical protein